MSERKPLIVLHGAIRTPPLSDGARIEAGMLLRRLQRGESLGLPVSRPMNAIGSHCGELRVVDEQVTWRLIYRVDADAVLVAEVFSKKTARTPAAVIARCRQRLRAYDDVKGG
jgi:phage-related protein